MTLVCKSVGSRGGIVNPIYGCGVEITPDINPIDVGLERSCPRDSKKVSCVGVSKKRARKQKIFNGLRNF